MTADRQRLTRRRVLESLGTVGTIGAVTGTGTVAYITDSNTRTGRIRAGQVNIHVDCKGCTVSDDQITVPFETFDPGETKTRRIQLTVDGESLPTQVWARTICPPSGDPLGEALQTRLAIAPECNKDESAWRYPHGTRWVTYNKMRRMLSDGIRLGESSNSCLTPGEELCLVFEYHLPTNTTWAAGSESEFGLELFAKQCRHAAATVEKPFSDVTCPELPCSDCVELGKLDVNRDRLEPGNTYSFDKLFSPFDKDGHDYALNVITVTDKVGDDERETVCASLRILRDGSETAAPPLCAVAIGGGKPSRTGGRGRTSGPSEEEPSDPDSRRVSYEVEPPLTRTRGELCAAHNKEDPDSEPDGRRPAISNVTVFVCADGGIETDEANKEVSDDESA
jgi:hypothetical protein